MNVSIHDPANPACIFTVPSQARVVSTGSVHVLSLSTTPIPWINDCIPDDRYACFFLRSSSAAYKKVAKKVWPVATSLPEDFRNFCWCPSDPLILLLPLPLVPPPFEPEECLTQEQLEALDLNRYNFLWPEEVQLLTYILWLTATSNSIGTCLLMFIYTDSQFLTAGFICKSLVKISSMWLHGEI